MTTHPDDCDRCVIVTDGTRYYCDLHRNHDPLPIVVLDLSPSAAIERILDAHADEIETAAYVAGRTVPGVRTLFRSVVRVDSAKAPAAADLLRVFEVPPYHGTGNRLARRTAAARRRAR